MLTVKHVQLNGNENIYLCESLEFEPYEKQIAGLGSSLEGRLILQRGGISVLEGHEIAGGVAYVMNDMGKTVAKYQLGAFDPEQRFDLTSSELIANFEAQSSKNFIPKTEIRAPQ